MKNMLVALNTIIDDLFSVGTQRVQLFETVSKMLNGTCELVFQFFPQSVDCDRYLITKSFPPRQARQFMQTR